MNFYVEVLIYICFWGFSWIADDAPSVDVYSDDWDEVWDAINEGKIGIYDVPELPDNAEDQLYGYHHFLIGAGVNREFFSDSDLTKEEDRGLYAHKLAERVVNERVDKDDLEQYAWDSKHALEAIVDELFYSDSLGDVPDWFRELCAEKGVDVPPMPTED